MTKIHLILAQAQAAAPTGAQPPAGPMGLLISAAPFIFVFGAMYFLMIAPQRKKQKQHEAMLAALKSGDEIITTGGIYGTITSVKDDRFVVRVGGDNVKVEVGKGFISTVVSRTETP